LKTGRRRSVRREVVGANLKSRNQSFGWCTSTTATEHVIEVATPPLAVQPAEVGLNWCASVPATARSGLRKIRWCLHLVAENGHFEPPKSECRARWNISPETTRRLCYLRALVRWLLPPWSAFVLFKRERGGRWGEDLDTWAWRSGLDSASPIARSPGDAR
jgi:hypothetical protein